MALKQKFDEKVKKYRPSSPINTYEITSYKMINEESSVFMPKNPYYSGTISDHFDGTYFYNPNGTPPNGFSNMLKWQFGEKTNHPWPEYVESPFESAKPNPKLNDDALRLTMVGHASFFIQMGGLNILTDPVWSERTSPFTFIGPKRRNKPGIAFDDLPKIDIILLTHNHYDHLDITTLKRLHEVHAPLLITPLGNDTIIHKKVPDMNIKTGDWNDVIEFKDTKFHLEPCHHWSARGTRDRRMALWAAFVIEHANTKIYHIGDTGFHDGINYRAAAEKHGKFDLAILPIGAYEPRWFMKGQHQNPFEAAKGFKLCKTKRAAGHHFGTFKLTNEGIEQPVEHLSEALEIEKINPDHFRPMRPGQVWDIL